MYSGFNWSWASVLIADIFGSTEKGFMWTNIPLKQIDISYILDLIKILNKEFGAELDKIELKEVSLSCDFWRVKTLFPEFWSFKRNFLVSTLKKGIYSNNVLQISAIYFCAFQKSKRLKSLISGYCRIGTPPKLRLLEIFQKIHDVNQLVSLIQLVVKITVILTWSLPNLAMSLIIGATMHIQFIMKVIQIGSKSET